MVSQKHALKEPAQVEIMFQNKYVQNLKATLWLEEISNKKTSIHIGEKK